VERLVVIDSVKHLSERLRCEQIMTIEDTDGRLGHAIVDLEVILRGASTDAVARTPPSPNRLRRISMAAFDWSGFRGKPTNRL
jgi:hypothetical protein